MIPDNRIAVCGPEQGPHLALCADGALWKDEGAGWAPFDFNGLYAGYYPACRFTALCYTGSFWLGGESRSMPYLFTSLMGGVWTERSIEMNNLSGGLVLPRGTILRILWDGEARQAHLVMSSGQLITLPDCAKCVRIRMVADEGVTDGRLEGGSVVLTLTGGEVLRVPLHDLTQLRVAWSWAGERIRAGAPVLDLRQPGERSPLPWPARRMSQDEAWAWLQEQPKQSTVFLLCEKGIKADVLAQKAHKAGFGSVWSLGGTDPRLHVE